MTRLSRPLALAATLAAVAACLLAGQAREESAPPSDSSFSAGGAIYPRLSASGEQIAFSYQGAIWRIPRAGGTMTRLTFDDGYDIEPAWSLDSATIAYLKTKDFLNGTLQLIRAADGAAMALPRAVLARDKLAFSRDGKRLLGTFVDINQKPRLCWLDLASGELGQPIFPAQGRQRYALSHDHRWIVQATFQDVPDQQAGNNGPACDLWKVPAEGGEPRKLTQFPARIFDLCWTADDRALLVVTCLGGAHYDLWRVPLVDAERGATRITFGAADEECPSVSADGRWLLMTDNRDGPTRLALHDLSNGAVSHIEVARQEFGQPTGRLELNIVDAGGKPLTARCSIRHADGKYSAPPGSLYRIWNRELTVYVEGQAAWTLPAGRYQVQAAHGPEYRLVRAECEIRAGETTVQTVALDRWIDQPARGWHSGENHIHANYGYGHWYNSPRTMLAQCAGEDLRVCNFMVANSDGDGVFDREYFRGRADPLSTGGTLLYWNEEYRSTIWGHMTLLNLKQVVEPLFTGFPNTTNPHDTPTNADAALATHDQQGHVNFTHPAFNINDPYLSAYSAKELPIDVALGVVDSIDVMGSGHQATVPLWYRLLNCGFRIPASAGTDCFLNRINSRVPGADRAYVHIDGEFSYQRWIEGLQAGRTFVTNGPMLEFTVDGQEPGATLRLDGPREVAVAARVRAAAPLRRVELVYNGEVAATAEITGDGRDIILNRNVPVKTGGWLALRAQGPPRPGEQQIESYAHTSPVYLAVAGAPLDSRADAEYFLAWIDRLWEAVRHRNRIPPRLQPHVESQISAARAVYRKLAGR